jgi:hypothetical protein
MGRAGRHVPALPVASRTSRKQRVAFGGELATFVACAACCGHPNGESPVMNVVRGGALSLALLLIIEIVVVGVVVRSHLGSAKTMSETPS